MEMSRLTRDGTAEPVSRDQSLRRERRQENIHFPCSADHVQDWQPYPVDPYSAICDDHTYYHNIQTRFLHKATRAVLSEKGRRVDDLYNRQDQTPEFALISFLRPFSKKEGQAG